VYSHAILDNDTNHVFILDRNEIDKRRKKATTQAVWGEWFQEMAIKTAIRAHYKYLPKTEQLNHAMELVDKEMDYTNHSVKEDNSLPAGLMDEIQEAQEVTESNEPNEPKESKESNNNKQ
jgi:recombinational DNA repair protein RecT